MQMTEHFTLEEYVATNHRTIDNSLPDHLMPNAMRTLVMMEHIRASLSQAAGRDIPINSSSGYRCLALNRSLGSDDTSDHVQALAMDWTAASFGSPYAVCLYLSQRTGELGIGQLIHEFGRWIHCSPKEPANPINRVITISNAGTFSGIHKV
jgi:hypothetical protein